MGSAFNPLILVEKLAKLNSSQQSIETLSHWCIFHMNKAKQVVETWDRQFHCSPREQRLAYLYLANDILQNSRRKGSEFVGEFWKVLPDALRDVIESGDEFGKKASLRLVSIWEERKVFGSRGQLLKDEIAGRHIENNSNRTVVPSGFKLRPSAGNALDKIVSDFQVVYGGQLDEDVILNKCRNAISCIEKVDKETEGDVNSGNVNGFGVVEELQGQHSVLRNCIEQLVAVESSRANLVSHLKEALQEQEFKLDQIRNELEEAKSRSEQASNLCRQLLNGNNNNNAKETTHQTSEEAPLPPNSSISGSVPVMYTRRVVPTFGAENSGDEDTTKAAAAAVAAKLTASTSSAQMLTYVLSSLASEGVIGNSTSIKEDSLLTTDHQPPPEKKTKLDSHHHPSYVPPQQPPQELDAGEQQPPPPPSSPPPIPPPLPPMLQQTYAVVPPLYMQAAAAGGPPINYLPTYGFGTTPLQPPAMPLSFPINVGAPPMMMMLNNNGVSSSSSSSSFAAPPNVYQSAQGSESGGFYSQSPMAPISRQ